MRIDEADYSRAEGVLRLKVPSADAVKFIYRFKAGDYTFKER